MGHLGTSNHYRAPLAAAKTSTNLGTVSQRSVACKPGSLRSRRPVIVPHDGLAASFVPAQSISAVTAVATLSTSLRSQWIENVRAQGFLVTEGVLELVALGGLLRNVLPANITPAVRYKANVLVEIEGVANLLVCRAGRKRLRQGSVGAVLVEIGIRQPIG